MPANNKNRSLRPLSHVPVTLLDTQRHEPSRVALRLSSPRRFIIRSFTSIVHYHAETLTDRVKHLPIV